MEFVLEILVMILLKYPGALLRWLYYLGRKDYSGLLNDKNPNTNTIVSLFLIAMIVILVCLIKSII
jgi:hypothetical protein